MSFGGSPGDIIAAGTLALRAYRACRAAAGDFAEVTRELSAVSILVQDLEDQAATPTFAQDEQACQKQAKIRSLIDGIVYPLRELEQLAVKYSSLSTAKKNNWDRLRFAAKNIADIRTRLIFHTAAAQAYLDGLANRSVIRIERHSNDTNAALNRIEQVLADIVKDIKHGSRDPSVVSDEKWNVWTELRRELRTEGYPVEIIKQHKHRIKQYFLDLLLEAGLQEEISPDEIDFSEVDGEVDEAQFSLGAQTHSKTAAMTRQVRQRFPKSDLIQLEDATQISLMFKFRIQWLLVTFCLVWLPIVIFLVGIPQSTSSQSDRFAECELFLPSPTQERASILSSDDMVLLEDSELGSNATWRTSFAADMVTLELKAGLMKNIDALTFHCVGYSEAQDWIDQLSPLFDPDVMDELAIRVTPAYGTVSFNPEKDSTMMTILSNRCGRASTLKW